MRKFNFKTKKVMIPCVSIVAIMLFSTAFIFKSELYQKAYAVNSLEKRENVEYLSTDVNLNSIKIVAHKGICNNEPENSISSIKSSINHKVDYAEIDVQETKDGVVVLMHDKNLRRLTGVNTTVDKLTYSQLRNLRIHQPFKSQYKDERIPTLNEVMAVANNKRKLIIEIKPYGNTRDITTKVVNMIDKNNFTKQCMVHSMSYNIILQVKEENPDITTGYIVFKRGQKLPIEGVDFYSVEQGLITPNMVENIHRLNKTIYAWTVDGPRDMKRVMKLNVDGIITDKPTILLDSKKTQVHKI
jgi:glycerophosphoryl diester phosphodiesterase